jgi:hypothetical protein
MGALGETVEQLHPDESVELQLQYNGYTEEEYTETVQQILLVE